MPPAFLSLLAAIAMVSWWLSRYDSKVKGQDVAADSCRRLLRSAITVVLMMAGWGGFGFIGVAVLLGVLWAPCLSELFARGLYQLVDSSDSRPFDSNHISCELDRLAGLVKRSQPEQAIALGQQLLATGEVSVLAMEAIFVRLYDQLFVEAPNLPSAPLAAAMRLSRQGHFLAAESRLRQLLASEPGNLRAAAMLMRLYTRDLHRPAQAYALVVALEEQSLLPPGFGDYSREAIARWMDAGARKEHSTDGIESLLVQKRASPHVTKATHP
jgi:hypothetical protein